jgi:hypothetical protein
MYKNSEILSAVLNKWAQPLIETFLKDHMQSMPFMVALQNKIRSTGWVSPNWNLYSELSPLMESVTGTIVAPMVNRYVSMVDDSMIPKLAHNFVDNAIDNTELSLFEGKIVFEEDDLKRLKRLLELNLPYDPADDIKIKTE